MKLIEETINTLAKMFADMNFCRDSQEQAFDKPAFYVYLVRGKADRGIMNQQTNHQTICITWFPDTKEDVDEQCERMASKLLTEFRFVQKLNLHALNPDVKVQDGVVIYTFSVQYNMRYVEQSVSMNKLTAEGSLKID